jgi:AcrR family transcriptional regulator
VTSTDAVVTRTPQAERTAATRLRLMEATIDCLVELGWTGTTTTIVSERAGVSRGAQLHHFPTKQDLVVSAVAYLMDRRREELNVVLGDLPKGERVRAALELVSHQFTSPVFFAALELWVAARSDAELLKSVGPLERQVGRETHKHAIKILGIDEAKGNNRALVQATLDLLRGLGLAASLSDDSARRARILDAWADVLERELELDE